MHVVVTACPAAFANVKHALVWSTADLSQIRPKGYMNYQLLNSMHCYSPTPCLWLTPLYEESEWVGQVV